LSYYDDPEFNYSKWWTGREYEHQAEVMALHRLLGGRRFGHAVDVGGGYGRLSVVLTEYADNVTLIDSSLQQLEISEKFLARYPSVSRRHMAATEMDFPDGSVDLVTMIRVLHHLPDPSAEFGEVSRILRPGGQAVIEVANNLHAVNRMRYLIRRQQAPAAAVDIGGDASPSDSIPYVNHHPGTVARQLAAAGLKVRQQLSVSNLRHPLLKGVMPKRAMLAVERAAQQRLARVWFGPSLFYLLEK
jgi:SAM-dependent methyltransferase